MNTQHNTEFFQQSIFIINDANEIEETALESFLREFCEGDPARAWYLKDVEGDTYYSLRHENGTEVAQCDTWNEVDEMKANAYEETAPELLTLHTMRHPNQWEVREGLHSNITRNRLVGTFETEVEANEYHLNGLYWNYCNKSFDAPFHADTREECEAEVNERKAIAAAEQTELANTPAPMEKQDEIGGDTAKAVAKHTPGPWTINNSMSGTYVYQGDSENCIAYAFADVHEDQDANARLIAAAPELLEAVKDLLDIIHDDLTHARQEDHKEALSAARAAIAKASEQQ